MHDLKLEQMCTTCWNFSNNIFEKSQQHPKDFPGGPPPQYYPGLATVNFRVRMGSGVFVAVWPLATVQSANTRGHDFNIKKIINFAEARRRAEAKFSTSQ